MSASTEQEKVKGNPNPSPTTRFGAENGNPQSPGGWKKENTISYQYNRFMNMDEDELKAFAKVPAKEKTVAMMIAFKRVIAALGAKGLMDAKEITDRTEGKSKEFIDMTSGGDKIQFGNMVPRNKEE